MQQYGNERERKRERKREREREREGGREGGTDQKLLLGGGAALFVRLYHTSQINSNNGAPAIKNPTATQCGTNTTAHVMLTLPSSFAHARTTEAAVRRDVDTTPKSASSEPSVMFL